MYDERRKKEELQTIRDILLGYEAGEAAAMVNAVLIPMLIASGVEKDVYMNCMSQAWDAASTIVKERLKEFLDHMEKPKT